MNDVVCTQPGPLVIEATTVMISLYICAGGDTNSFRFTDANGNDITTFKENAVVYYTNTLELDNVTCMFIADAHIIDNEKYSRLCFMMDKKLLIIGKGWDGTLPQGFRFKVLIV